MRHKLATIPTYYIIILLIFMPPIGYYFAATYRSRWVQRNPWFTILVVFYSIFIIVGLILAKIGA